MITNHDVELIARKDAAMLHTDSAKYVGSNLFQYYTCCNSWILLVKAHSSIASLMLESALKHYGLIPTIAESNSLASELEVDQVDNGKPGSLRYSLIAIISGQSRADALQILRYAKRFTPDDCSSMALDCIKQFKATNNRIKLLNRRNERLLSNTLRDDVQEEFNKLIEGYQRVDVDLPIFSNGVSYVYDEVHKVVNGRKTTELQYIPRRSAKCVSEKLASWPTANFGAAYYPNPCYNVDMKWVYRPGLAHLTSVPKSYKTYRTIAVETCYQQAQQQAIRTGLEEVLSKVSWQAPIHNQLVNGVRALLCRLSTIDLSSASDSISFWLLGQLCCGSRSSTYGRKLYHDVVAARSRYYVYDNTANTLHMVCTMGNGFCFALETLIFLAIARAACKVAARWLGIEFDCESSDVSVYGDDIIVPQWAFETVVSFLEAWGFIVNTDKSFTDDEPFRESCGFDWYDGEFVSSTYWPRKVVHEDINSAPYLASLEGRLFERGSGTFYFECTEFLRKQTERIAPKVSTVPIDIYVEYNLNARCLVGICGERNEVSFHRDTAIPGETVKRSYDEVRLYANLLTPTYKTVDISPALDMYQYVSFLKNGPRYEDGVSQLLAVSQSYRSKFDIRIPDQTTVSRQRLI